MAVQSVKRNECDSAAMVKAALPVENRGKLPPGMLPKESLHLIYCARCGMRSQPIASEI